MQFYSSSKKLISNIKNFYCVSHFNLFKKITKEDIFLGWGRKKSGLKAIKLAKKYKASFMLLEDGFIRSLDLGINNSPSFSLVYDEVGIYYDASAPSKLENILNTYFFNQNELQEAKKAIALIKKYQISKYNNFFTIPQDYFTQNEDRVLIITQVSNDASLKFGLAEKFNTLNIINDAINENPKSTIYIKIHPDVLMGKKHSDFNVKKLPKNCKIISENFNPIDLLQYFKKVYTKTSGMGFESLMMGCECVCYGMPFYAGWGVTHDKITCARRIKQRSIEEIFYAAYILYTQYFNPYLNQTSDIFDTIKTLNKMQKKETK